MKANRSYIAVLVLLAAIILGPAGDALAGRGPRGFGGPHEGKGFCSNLTAEQMETIRTTVTEMREAGATREEIHAAVGEMLRSYGVQLPENWEERGPRHRGPGRGFGRPGGRFLSQLTDEQRETVHARVTEMREAGATREEIHAAVGEMLKSYGVQLPENWEERGPRHRGPGRGFLSTLTEEQREALRAKRAEMREAGATREEIHAAVREMLRSYGVQLPENWEERRPGSAPSQKPDGASSATTDAGLPLLTRNYPNPFNPATRISYATEVAGKVSVQIYNVEGQLVRTFDEGYRPAGNYELSWDGRHANGKPAASGIYFYRIQAGPHSVTNRMILLR